MKMHPCQGLFAAIVVLAACAPVRKDQPPAIDLVGTGIVQAVVREDGDDGESPAGRAVIGLLSAGIVGAVAAAITEDNLARRRYAVRLGSTTRSFVSHAVVQQGDCVRVEAIRGSRLSVLTMLEAGQCSR